MRYGWVQPVWDEVSYEVRAPAEGCGSEDGGAMADFSNPTRF